MVQYANYNNGYNNKFNRNGKNLSNNDNFSLIKYNSQNIRNVNIINGIKLGDKPYEKTNLKPINEDRRRIGGGGRF